MPVRRGRTLALLRRLRQAGKVAPPKKRVGRIPRRRPPEAIGREYRNAIVRHVCSMARAVFAEVEPEILDLLRSLRSEQGRTDADSRKNRPKVIAGHVLFAWQGSRADELITKAARVFARKLRPEALQAMATQFGARTDKHARAQLDAQLRSAIGVPLSSIERPMQDRIGEWEAENVALITTVPERYFERLHEDVQEAFAGGMHPNTLADQFVERYEMSENDAERIARDQTLKLSADLNHARMEAIGVERAVWRTMNDNRVSDDCYELEGVEFELSEGVPPDGLLPGESHPVCRCFSEPVLDDLLGPDES